jgi:hypothetical protein
MGVVEVALVFIAEDLVGSAGLLELGLGLFAQILGYFVGVVFQCGLYELACMKRMGFDIEVAIPCERPS